MKISHYILSGFLIILLLFSATTFINYRLSEDMAKNSAYLIKSTDIIRYSNRFQRNILTMVDALHGYLLTGEKSFIESYDVTETENVKLLRDLSMLITDASQKQILKEIEALNDQWEKENIDPLKKAKTISGISPQNLTVFNNIYKKKVFDGYENKYQTAIKEKFKAFSSFEYLNRDQKIKNLAATVPRTEKLSLLLNAIALIAALAVVGFIVRKISRQIGYLTQKAKHIAAGNYDTDTNHAGKDELTTLYPALNSMATDLSKNVALLTKSHEQLNKLAYTVSHDLYSPLRQIRHIISSIDSDGEKELSPKTVAYLESIKERVIVAEKLIERLLSYSRISSEVIEKDSVDVNDLVNEVVMMFHRINITFRISPLPVIYSEWTLLFQVFSRLINNAVKYNDKENGEIQIYYQEELKSYRFFIKDNGIGIPLDQQESIFLIQEPTIGANIRDTELGLPLVKKILDSKNQKINVVSELGLGSTFSFTWPKFRYNTRTDKNF